MVLLLTVDAYVGSCCPQDANQDAKWAEYKSEIKGG